MSKCIGFDALVKVSAMLAMCALPLVQAQDAYETTPVFSAATLLPTLLPPQLATGPNFQVQDQVINDGLMNSYQITSPFGTFEARSDAELAKRVQEIGAIAKLKQLESSDEFGKGIASAASNVAEGTKSLVTSPVKTIGGVFKGVGAAIQRTSDSVLGDPKSKYEDNALQAVAGVSQNKREFAAAMGVDPYSSNQVLQDALTRVARAGAAGSIVTAGALSAVSGGAGTFITVTGGSQTLNEILENTPPTDLRRMNREKLVNMGISADLIDLFFDNTNYSPTYQLLLIDALASMPDVGGKEIMLKIAISADTDALCMFRERQARMYAGYNAKVQPLDHLIASGNRMMAVTRDGKVVVAIPADYMVWTDVIAQALTGAEDKLKALKGVTGRELWIGGTVSPRVRAELEGHGWKVYDKTADSLIGPN